MTTTRLLQELVTNPDRLNDLVDDAKELAFHLGIIMRTEENPNSSEVVTYAPFTLFPSHVPKSAFLQALAVQSYYNTLVDKISQDEEFLEEALASTIQADDFTARLYDIHRQVQQEGRAQSIVVGLNRSDYMVDPREDGTFSLKQIEINTISVAGFGVTDRLPVVHRHVLRSVGLLTESECVMDTNRLPGMCAALAKGWELYSQAKAAIMFLVENSKSRHLSVETELWKRDIPVICRTFDDVVKQGYLDDDKKLFIDGLEVAVVYYRYGYMPDNYTEGCWDARLLMERSAAVKCPDISTHLAGTKKVQQVLARPGVLERFFPDQPQVVEQIRATFAGLYTLDMCPEGDQTVAMALANPDNFVLKPQREGGGNNYFGEDIVQVLQDIKNDKKRAAYILMDRIRPRPELNILVRRGCPLQLTSVCCELGIFGAYVRHGGELVLNEVTGHMMKTKNIEHNDGGIFEGICVFDSPLVL